MRRWLPATLNTKYLPTLSTPGNARRSAAKFSNVVVFMSLYQLDRALSCHGNRAAASISPSTSISDDTEYVELDGDLFVKLFDLER